MDRITPEQRSFIMSKIRSKNTKPEIIVRKYLYHSGFRYRLNVKKLPGKPDIVMRKHSTVIFVNGCFWHQHKNCNKANFPKSNVKYWKSKFSGNVKRDKSNHKKLKELSFKVLIIWECQVKYPKKLDSLIKKIG